MQKLLATLLLLVSNIVFSQQAVVVDTISITLNDAEEQFFKNNYFLLAQKYNVDASKALVKQAGLFNNPNVYYENSIFNKFSGKYFPTQEGVIGHPETQGEFILQTNWLFSIAGKRNKSVKVAKVQADIAQYQFDDLIRTLLFALRSDFYQLHYGLQSLNLFNDEIKSLVTIVNGFEEQYKKGNISLRELTRVRALLFSMQNDRLVLYNDLQQTLKEFSVLLNNNKPAWYKPQLNESETEGRYNLSKIVLADLVAQAQQSRPDYKLAQAQVNLSEANLKLQKAIGVPDITAQGVFDRNGSYIPNYSAVALSIPIGIFNRNQGSIKSAKLQVEAANQLLQQKQVIVQNDVFASYQKVLETNNLNTSLSSTFSTDFNTVLAGAQSNYEKKNLSLLEFVDLFESYKQSMIQYYSIKAQRYSAFEELNFNVGKNVFKQ
jgi:cobalt-zinc-cadmium efflux system outer membrane protein